MPVIIMNDSYFFPKIYNDPELVLNYREMLHQNNYFHTYYNVS